MTSRVIFIGFLASMLFSSSLTLASDPSPLQDFCVADTTSSVRVNGLPCKDPATVEATDFYVSGMLVTRNTTNNVGSNVTLVNAAKLPGLNTLGISLARIDFAPGGINPPHIHPRATEMLIMLQGKIEVGFVTSNPENRLITKILIPGDIFVFPVGLVHYQRNVNTSSIALAFATLSSQNPDTIIVANAVFGSTPPIPADILAKAFQLDLSVVNYLESTF